MVDHLRDLARGSLTSSSACSAWPRAPWTILAFLTRLLAITRDDMYAQDSIDLLQKSGIDFKKHEDYGIDVDHFGEMLMSSGLVLMDDVKWISFHRWVTEFS